MSWRSDRGSATIWMLGLGAVVLAVAMLTVTRGSAVLARHRLERTADLTALAAAQQIGRAAQPCAAASRIAAANAAALTSCTARLDPSGRSGTVAVTVRQTVGFPLLGARTLTSRARAGRQPAVARPQASPTRGAPLAAAHSRLRSGALLAIANLRIRPARPPTAQVAGRHHLRR